MSSTLIKTLFAGAVAAGALLLSGSAAQAAGNHIPCDGPGFGGPSFIGGGFGFDDDDFGLFGDDFGFRRHDFRDDRPTVIVINIKDKKHHKPAAASAAGTANSAGYHHKPAHMPAAATNDGY
jgi:hypothetical protein